MPDNCRWAEGDDLSLLLKAPAKVDIITRLPVLGVEAADFVEGPAVERHVAPGNMLSHNIRQQNMAGAAGCGRDAGLLPVLGGGRDIGAANAGVVP